MISEAIKALYENEALSPDQISEALEMPIESIKVSLLQNSPKFRQDIKLPSNDKDFTDDELETAKIAIARCMNAEDEHLAFKAAKFVFNERKGRHNIKSLVKNVNLNINLINAQMQNARAAKERAINKKPVKEIQVKDESSRSVPSSLALIPAY